ncbi:MAG: VIT domain-containing protein [Bacteroidota bacterium]
MKKYPILLVLSFFFLIGYSQNETDQSLSPYFLVKGDETTIEAFPLERTDVEVNIAGVIADVAVTQHYKNEGLEPIEAVYVFPSSTRAAVYGMEMKVGDRIIVAEIAEKQAARQQYEQAKTEGKRASLLEQNRPNVFTMNVANIMPGDRVEVVLHYTELLIPEEGQYEFVYPTVVGPRYTGEGGGNTGFTNMPYTQAGVAPGPDFNLSIFINGGMPLQDLSSSSHKIRTFFEGTDAAKVLLDASERKGGNRDFILQYNFEGNQIQTGMLVYEGAEENFFLCMAQPPKHIEPAFIPSREYIFVMDISGSMRGFPLEVSKDLMRNLVSQLRLHDRFNVLFFAGGSRLWSPESKPATPANLDQALNFMSRINGGGGTNLLSALQRGMNLPRLEDDLSRSIIVITDGYVSVEAKAFEYVRQHLNQSNLFAFGIGSSVNRHLIEGLAYAGQGEPFIVTQKQEGFEVAKRFHQYIKSPVMTQISACYDEFAAYDTEPATIPDVLSERPVILFGKYKGPATGNIYLEGYSLQLPNKSNGLPYPQRIKLTFPLDEAKADARNVALKYLWARAKIRNLADFNSYGMDEATKQEVTQLGLKYNLLTDYTSFIAVEKEIANANADSLKTVKQPLPLPQGVENSAIGFQVNIKGISGVLPQQKSYGLWMVGLLILFVLLKIFSRKHSWFNFFVAFVLMGSLYSCSPDAEAVVSTNEHQSVTFILGEDASPRNAFYQTAKAYFSTDSVESTPLVIDHCHSIVEVLDWLEWNAPTTGPWQTINLVVHGNEWTGINVAIDERGERCSSANLKVALQESRLHSLNDQAIDQTTIINLFGCNVGKDEVLLRTLGQAFGGTDTQRPTVSSAPYFNIFEQEKVAFSRHLAESFFIAFPAGSFPGNTTLAQQFEQKYPDVAIDWKHALHQLKPTPIHRNIEIMDIRLVGGRWFELVECLLPWDGNIRIFLLKLLGQDGVARETTCRKGNKKRFC